MLKTQTHPALSEQEMQEIKQALDLIQAKLPFLITLSVNDRKRLYKMGDKRFAFAKNSLSAAQNNPNILPASFDVEGFANDYQLTMQVSELLLRFQQLEEQLDDTALSLGSQVLNYSLTVYDYVKTAAKKTPGLKSVAEQLSTLFKAMKNRTPQGEPPENPNAN
jgi:hypothetical protein